MNVGGESLGGSAMPGTRLHATHVHIGYEVEISGPAVVDAIMMMIDNTRRLHWHRIGFDEGMGGLA